MMTCRKCGHLSSIIKRDSITDKVNEHKDYLEFVAGLKHADGFCYPHDYYELNILERDGKIEKIIEVDGHDNLYVRFFNAEYEKLKKILGE